MKRSLLVIAAVLVMSAAVWAQMGGMMAGSEQQSRQWGWGPGMMGGYGAGYGMGWFGGIVMMVFWVLLIVGLVFLIKWLAASAKPEGRGAGETPIEILKKRYARGEINKEEFEEKKKDLL